MPGIWIFVELSEGSVRSETWELMSVASEVADGQQDGIRLLTFGSQLNLALGELSNSSADEIYAFQDDRFDEPWPEAYFQAIVDLIGDEPPEVLLFPHTALGDELAARVSIRLKCALVQGVVDVKVDQDGLVAHKYVYGGGVLAKATVPKGPWVIVPQPRAFPSERLASSTTAKIVWKESAQSEGFRTARGVLTRQSKSLQDIEGAKVIVAGGRGLGGPDGFGLLGEVAELLNGVVAASRPVCDSGWVDRGLQVGLTGKTVAPDLYMAVGISGAIQHLMGCSGSKMIVAVNNDPGAPIFRIAHYGIVGDWAEVMSGLRDALASAAIE